MHEKTISGFVNEFTKISAGLAPAGAPTVNSKGAGLAPKLPKITGLPKSNLGTMGSPMGKMAEALFDELGAISTEILKEADFKTQAREKVWQAMSHPKGVATAAGLGSAAWSAGRSYAQEQKERAKDVQQGLSPEDQKKNRRRRAVGAAINAGMTGSMMAGLGYGVGRANKWARDRMKAENVGSVIGDYADKAARSAVDEIKKKHTGSYAGEVGADIGAQAAKRVKRRVGRATGASKLKIRLKMLGRKVNRNFKRNLRNAANHKFASVQ